MNIIVIASTILLSGLAVYNTACVLVDSLGDLNDVQQAQFNSSLFNYLMIFAAVAIIAASLLQYSMTKKPHSAGTAADRVYETDEGWRISNAGGE